jgi:hypothetical protein
MSWAPRAVTTSARCRASAPLSGIGLGEEERDARAGLELATVATLLRYVRDVVGLGAGAVPG